MASETLKASAESLVPVVSVPVGRSRFAVLSELFKARLTTLVILTTAMGFHLGNTGPVDWLLFLHAVMGTALLAAGAAASNEYVERDHDARMPRTATRPIPAGEIRPETALILGVTTAVMGLTQLAIFVNPLTAFLGMVTLASYVFVYTPLKRRTTLNTLVGAIPGAVPPLMGWTAATNSLDAGGWVLFAILFFWQLPHFMAIAWLYREDYAKGGYKMLPVLDTTGQRTAATAIRHTLVLLIFSLMPFTFGLAGRWYLAAALVMGMAFLGCGIQFAIERSSANARRLFFASIIYLPLLLGVLVGDKRKPAAWAEPVASTPGASIQPSNLE